MVWREEKPNWIFSKFGAWFWTQTRELIPKHGRKGTEHFAKRSARAESIISTSLRSVWVSFFHSSIPENWALERFTFTGNAVGADILSSTSREVSSHLMFTYDEGFSIFSGLYCLCDNLKDYFRRSHEKLKMTDSFEHPNFPLQYQEPPTSDVWNVFSIILGSAGCIRDYRQLLKLSS